MKLTYTALCIALLSTAVFAGETTPVPKFATHPAPPASTRCPPAAATQPPPTHARHPGERNPDEKVIPGRPMEPKPVDQPPPPPCAR
jgi:hypothetical protein